MENLLSKLESVLRYCTIIWLETIAGSTYIFLIDEGAGKVV
jgi:hypothetical protein